MHSWRARGLVLLLALAGGCGEGKKQEAEPARRLNEQIVDERKVPEDHLLVRPMEQEDSTWKDHWLETLGWEVFGYTVETGGAGTFEFRWTDPREGVGGEVAAFSCRVSKRRTVHVIFGVHTSPMFETRHTLVCPDCGAETVMQGAWLPRKVRCHQCKEAFRPRTRWDTAETIYLRILVLGRTEEVDGKGDLQRAGFTPRLEETGVWLTGVVHRRHLLPKTGSAFDTATMMRTGTEFLIPPRTWGTVALQIHAPAGEGSGTSIRNRGGRREYTFESGKVRITGSDEGYRIEVSGMEVPVEHYLHPVRKVEARFSPR
jgi:hypothetical protein